MIETRAPYTVHEEAILDRLLTLMTVEQLCLFVDALERAMEAGFGRASVVIEGRDVNIEYVVSVRGGKRKTPPG